MNVVTRCTSKMKHAEKSDSEEEFQTESEFEGSASEVSDAEKPTMAQFHRLELEVHVLKEQMEQVLKRCAPSSSSIPVSVATTSAVSLAATTEKSIKKSYPELLAKIADFYGPYGGTDDILARAIELWPKYYDECVPESWVSSERHITKQLEKEWKAAMDGYRTTVGRHTDLALTKLTGISEAEERRKCLGQSWVESWRTNKGENEISLSEQLWKLFRKANPKYANLLGLRAHVEVKAEFYAGRADIQGNTTALEKAIKLRRESLLAQRSAARREGMAVAQAAVQSKKSVKGVDVDEPSSTKLAKEGKRKSGRGADDDESLKVKTSKVDIKRAKMS